MSTKKFNRFSSPTVLTDDTPILGATAKQWAAALTGNMEITLQEVKRRVREVQAAKAHEESLNVSPGEVNRSRDNL
jgi:hypothetical protein